MSEFINNSSKRKAELKRLILKLHDGKSESEVRQELIETLEHVPYGEVVEVEQELISEGLPEEEVLKLCDIHSAVLGGHIDLSGAKKVPEGHPIEVMTQENIELQKVTAAIREFLEEINISKKKELQKEILGLRGLLINFLM